MPLAADPWDMAWINYAKTKLSQYTQKHMRVTSRAIDSEPCLAETTFKTSSILRNTATISAAWRPNK